MFYERVKPSEIDMALLTEGNPNLPVGGFTKIQLIDSALRPDG